MKKIIVCVLALIIVLAFTATALAVGNITGIQRSRDGSFYWSGLSNVSHDEITQAMTEGEMLFTHPDSKAVALVSPSVYCTVDRVRCYPLNYTTSPIDLRIDPNASSNWVGPNKVNGKKQVKTVQTILYYMGIPGMDEDSIDGICGPDTIEAIKTFQEEHGFTIQDGIVGAKTWRALCSSSGYVYGEDIW